MGRFPRSVEIITHRPVIGSFRNSGKTNPPTHFTQANAMATALANFHCTLLCPARKSTYAGLLAAGPQLRNIPATVILRVRFPRPQDRNLDSLALKH